MKLCDGSVLERRMPPDESSLSNELTKVSEIQKITGCKQGRNIKHAIPIGREDASGGCEI